MRIFLFIFFVMIGPAIVSAETIDQILKKVESGIHEEYMPYDLYELIVARIDPEIWPDYSSLPEPQRNLLLIVDFEGQINNGGFDQYYYNSYGDNAEDAVIALRKIGADSTAELLIRSFTVFPEGKPSKSRQKRWEQLEALDEKENEYLSSLDDKFYEYPDDLSTLLYRYLKNNVAIFRQ